MTPLIAKLPNLKYFAVSDANLSGSLPSELFTLQRLVTLDLSRNQLEGSLVLL